MRLSNELIFRAVANLKLSRSTCLLTTHFVECEYNADIETGDWRMLNFELEPFGWCKPERVLIQGCRESGGGYADKALPLWRISDIRDAPRA